MWIFRVLFGLGMGRKTDRKSKESEPDISPNRSGYFRDNPDALRPDIESDDYFDPTDYM